MAKLLLVDDVHLFLDLDRSLLNREDLEVHTFGTGSEALKQARRHRPDVVLLDAELPDMDGPECCRRLRAEPDLSHASVVLLAEPDRMTDCVGAGADGVVAKPLDARRVLDELGRRLALGQRRSARVSAALEVDYSSALHAGRGATKDVAEGGLFLRAVGPARGQVLELGFAVPVEPPVPVAARGRVVREVRSHPDSHLIPGVALAFEALDGAVRGALRRFVREGRN